MAKPQPIRHAHNFQDLVGRQFGRLTVLSYVGRKSGKHTAWLCRCNCKPGRTTTVLGISLKRGLTKSCGCLHKELMSKCHRTHGLSHTREHNAWVAMKSRCLNKNDYAYHNYGGRGIRVCKRWATSFKRFLADMGACPPRLSLDRINNNGDYKPSNCRWATRHQQARNQRTNTALTYKGQTKTVSEWAGIVGVKMGTLWYRWNKGWSAKDCIETPVRQLPTPE